MLEFQISFRTGIGILLQTFHLLVSLKATPWLFMKCIIKIPIRASTIIHRGSIFVSIQDLYHPSCSKVWQA